MVEGYEKIRLRVPNRRRVIAIPPSRFANRPQHSLPDVRGQSLGFPNGSLRFDLAGN